MTDSKVNSAAVGQPDLRALLEKWREKAQGFRARTYNSIAWQAIAIEVDRCADDLAAVLAVKDTPGVRGRTALQEGP